MMMMMMKYAVAWQTELNPPSALYEKRGIVVYKPTLLLKARMLIRCWGGWKVIQTASKDKLRGRRAGNLSTQQWVYLYRLQVVLFVYLYTPRDLYFFHFKVSVAFVLFCFLKWALLVSCAWHAENRRVNFIAIREKTERNTQEMCRTEQLLHAVSPRVDIIYVSAQKV